MKENSSTESPRERARRKDRIISIIVVLMVIPLGFVFLFRNSEDITLSDDKINIYLYVSGIAAIQAMITGGYEVYFDDIVDIELLPFSARQLGDRIDGLTVPPLIQTFRSTAQYDVEGNHRLHISLYADASPTIWITRYENVPVLLSFRYGHETEALYEQIVDAWLRSKAVGSSRLWTMDKAYSQRYYTKEAFSLWERIS